MTPALVALRTKPDTEPLTFRRFSDLAVLPSEPEWLWEGVLAIGAVTMLAGQPYVGKTTLVNGLLKAMEDGSPFLGRQTRKATALLVTEEHEVTLRPRAEELQLMELASEFVSRADGVHRLPWPELIERATARALTQGHQLLVVDTFTGLARLQAEEENDAGAITARLQPLVAAAGKGLAVLFLHHLNKNGQPRGSSAFRGVTDIALRMRREKGRKDFRLLIESRFPAPEALGGSLVSTREGVLYSELETRSKRRGPGARAGGADERLRAALRAAGARGLTYSEIGALPGLSRDKAKKRLPRWIGREVRREGGGKKGDPSRWIWLSA